MTATVQMVYDGQAHIGSLECASTGRTVAYAVQSGKLVCLGEFVDRASALRALPSSAAVVAHEK